MKIGAICSSGGSAFFEAFDILCVSGRHRPEDFSVVTDRACGAENLCHDRGVRYIRIEESSNDAFTRGARDYLRQQRCEAVFLYFARLVSPTLFAELPTFNIHPSLLPAFTGFGALRKARKAGVRFFGATLHLVTESTDLGPIIAQVMSPLGHGMDEDGMQRLSFVHKVYLTLSAIDLLENEVIAVSPTTRSVTWLKTPPRITSSANPALMSPEYKALFDLFQDRVDVGKLSS